MIKNMITFTNKFKQIFCIWIGPVPIFVVSNPSDVQVSPFKTFLKSDYALKVLLFFVFFFL